MTTPTPPPGYKLVKGIDIKDRAPEGALFWTDIEWSNSAFVGEACHKDDWENFYAIPSEPESITEEAKTSRKRDTLVDIVGYAECASKLEEPK
jgi:hypothetical protein